MNTGEILNQREKATDIEVQQSQSFEINDEEYSPRYQQGASQAYQQGHVYEDPVPVIVLRVPGPQKYALHLQALLQQYLEVRARQFIKALEHQERQGHLMHPQHYVAQQYQQAEYIPMVAISPMYHHQQYYQLQPQQNDYQQYYQVQHENRYQIPPGEQSYYQNAQALQQPQEIQQPQIHQEVEQVHHQVEEEYPHGSAQVQAHVEQPQVEHIDEQAQHGYEALAQKQPQVFPTSYINFVTPGYDQQEDHQYRNHHAQEPLETSENYPSEKHTQVIFKKQKSQLLRPSEGYHQSQPIVVAEAPQQLQQEEFHYQQQPEHSQSHRYTNIHSQYAASSGVEVVSVAQGSKDPINYHVKRPTLAPTIDELQARHNPKRMAPFTKEHFEKARRMMTGKSKRNRGSALMRQEKVQKFVVKTSS